MRLNNYTLERLQKLNKAAKRLKKSINNGNFYQLSAKKRQQLVTRIQKSQKQLQGFSYIPRVNKTLATASLALGLLVGTNGYAQTFLEGVENPFGISFDLDNFSDFPIIPGFVDFDGDGDFDLLTDVYYEYGSFAYFENIGDANNPSFAEALIDPFGFNLDTPNDEIAFTLSTFADLDGDGDIDVLSFVNAYNESSETYSMEFLYVENTGTLDSPDFSGDPVPFPFGLELVSPVQFPKFVDIDQDGDFDLMSGGYDSEMIFQENIGTATEPEFAQSVLAPFGINIVETSILGFSDVDGDGDIDLMTGQEDGLINYFENIGEDNIEFAEPVNNPFEFTPLNEDANLPAFVDIDGDGDQDAFLGEYGNIFFYEQIPPSPTAANGTAELEEDGSYEFVAEDFNFQGFEDGDELASITIVTLPENGTLSLGEELVEAGQVIPVADLENLSFTPDANAAGEEYASFDFAVSDGEFESQDSYQILLNVAAVNDLPTFAIEMDTSSFCIGAGSYNLNLSNIDAGGGEEQELSLEATSSNEMIANNIDIAYESPNADGIVSFDFGEEAGFANIDIVLNDSIGTTTQTFVVQLKDCTGINDITLNNNMLRVSPNPSSQFLNLNINRNISEEQRHLEIININGQTIFENIDLQETQIDVSALPSGTYLVKLTIGKEMAVKTIVVE